MRTSNSSSKTRFRILSICLFAAFVSDGWADWPTYQHDSSRSGTTTAQAPSNPKHAWEYEPPSRPIPAWDEPALWDGWGKVYDLKNRQVFDKAFHTAIADGRVYFGSSVDDQLHCLDASTGQTLWTYFTEGPIRLAPTIANGRVYFGSDDGFVYCVSADNGELIWKKSPGPANRRLAGNGRVISPWAIRTSVVIQDDTAYCGAGVIPSEGVYVVAMNADSGEQIWKTQMTDLPAQGYMLASQTKLYVVTSRDTPVVLDAKTGERLHKVKGGAGGTYALLTGDTLLYGPSKTGDVNMVGESQEVLAAFQGNHMIVAQPLSYLQSKDELSSLDRGEYVRVYGERNEVSKSKSAAEKKLKKIKEAKEEEQDADQIETLEAEIAKLTEESKTLAEELKACLKWKTKCTVPFSLILAGDVLIGGGDGEVIGVNATNGKELWKLEVPGKAYGLALSDGKLFVSTDEGTIHCFADGATGIGPSTSDRQVRHQSFQGTIETPERMPPEINGPFTEFVDDTSVKIEWDTVEPMTSELTFGIDMKNARLMTDDNLKTRHSFVVDKVQREVVYRFKVSGKTEQGDEIETEAYRFDSHLNYVFPKSGKIGGLSFDSAKYDRDLDWMIETAGRRGYALVVGAKTGQLAYELARKSDLKVIIVEKDPAKAKALRETLGKTPQYGTRIVVHEQDLSKVQYGPFLANLIVSESSPSGLPASVETLYSCLRPAGGLMVLGQFDETTSFDIDSSDAWKGFADSDEELLVHQRPRLPDTGEWTHQYASADNSACSKDDQITGELAVQWWGRPGARPMPDRGNRNPPPVSANGRLYIQGNRTLFGLDAYNGTILWAKQLPTMRRANMPRDGSNMVAADDHVCLAIAGKCIAFDGQTGERKKEFEIPEQLAADRPDEQHDWGYVSRIESKLFGSAVRTGSQYMGDKGEWYEGAGDKDTAKVTSDAFFAKNVYTGKTEWYYSDGQIINSTITIADGRVFFIESRGDAAKAADTGRLTSEVLTDQVLVALDAVTGKVIWEQRYDFTACRYVTYMTYGSGTLLITGTDEKNVFHTFAFNGEDGKAMWQHDAPMKKGHHTGQLAHPTIVGNLVYFNKHTYELLTGKVVGVHDFDWHGCGVMSASNHTVFSRYEYHGMLDLKTKKRTEFLGIRSGCWLSLIPSGGLLLAPETSAGCSCGHSIQTSIAYVPKQLMQVKTVSTAKPAE